MLFPNPQKLKDLSYIFSRNVFLLTNGIIFFVVILLYVFGDTESALFVGLVLTINMVLGLAQDIRAWLALENLQLLTAPHITRIENDQSEQSILIEAIQKDDLIKLVTGDQIPCDGVLISAHALELNEGLITGESTSLPRQEGDDILGGSIVTAGEGIMRVSSAYGESRIARMTEGIKSYSVQQSPIQHAVGTSIKYSGYLLIGIIFFITIRGYFTHESTVLMVKEIGALASTIVPQGLMFAMTLLFAYGAMHLFRRNVLLQEVNATEKLGRIKNLCLDKTGTLTENELSVSSMNTPSTISKEEAETLTAAYILGVKDSSQMITAIKSFIKNEYSGNILDSLPFSSWRSYGAVSIETNNHPFVIVAGMPEQFVPLIQNEEERALLQNILSTKTKEGERIFCLVRSDTNALPLGLSGLSVSLVAVFSLATKLRPGIEEAISFFQNRGVRIRIISGDHPDTVKTIAQSAGVNETDLVITGKEMATWTKEDYGNHSHQYSIFARVLPEQKEKIIEALKKDGFTAMVGDGANDALAIKKADLGIAMWQGAPATRQIASVVLMNNSFTELPRGVRLADSLIKNAEIFASTYLAFSLVGFLLFLWVSTLGYVYPLSPLNITLISYLTIGLPGILVSYWTIRPAQETGVPTERSFFSQVLPYTLSSSFLQACVIGLLFLYSPLSMKLTGTNLYVLIAFTAVGFIFFLFTPWVYREKLALSQVLALGALALLEVGLFIGIFHVPFLLNFFDVEGLLPSLATLGNFALVLMTYTFLQYVLARYFKKRHLQD